MPSTSSPSSLARLTAFMEEHVYPNEQAYHDFVHDPANLWQEWPGMEALKDKARVVIEDFRQDYNTERPHSSLGYDSPRRFASTEYKDSRAPQNLYPIAGLERQVDFAAPELAVVPVTIHVPLASVPGQ